MGFSAPRYHTHQDKLHGHAHNKNAWSGNFRTYHTYDTRYVGEVRQPKRRFFPTAGKVVRSAQEECEKIGRGLMAAQFCSHPLRISRMSQFSLLLQIFFISCPTSWLSVDTDFATSSLRVRAFYISKNKELCLHKTIKKKHSPL